MGARKRRLSLEARLKKRAVQCPLTPHAIRSLADFTNVISELLGPAGKYWFRQHGALSYELKPGALRPRIEEHRKEALGLLEEFKRVAEIKLTRTPPEPNDELRWMQVAQHYGLPTRLLDWSENPLVGLYFACQDREADEDGLVFVVNPGDLNRFTDRKVKRVLSGDADKKHLDYFSKLGGELEDEGTGPLASIAWSRRSTRRLTVAPFLLGGLTPSISSVEIRNALAKRTIISG